MRRVLIALLALHYGICIGNAQTVKTRPPTWDEVESDERFKALSSDLKLQTLENWAHATRQYGIDSGLFMDRSEREKFIELIDRKKHEYTTQMINYGLIPAPTPTPTPPAYDPSPSFLKSMGSALGLSGASVLKKRINGNWKRISEKTTSERDWSSPNILELILSEGIIALKSTGRVIGTYEAIDDTTIKLKRSGTDAELLLQVAFPKDQMIWFLGQRPFWIFEKTEV